MSLSEQEREALREIERSLLADDPSFATNVRDTGLSFGGGGSGEFSLRGIALVVLGLLLLVAGVALAQVSLWFIALSIVGFGVMFGAGVWMLRKPTSNAGGMSLSGGAQHNDVKRSSGASRMEDSFRRRFGGER